jgi:uncharacterized protein YndB with AHSA1/START domain
MGAATRVDTAARDREIVVARLVDAPRDLVFKAWTEPDRMARWWAPPGFTVAHCAMDVRPDGAFRFCLRSPEGVEHWRQGIYREVNEPERLVYSFAWADAEGRSQYETLVTVIFAERGEKTELILHQSIFKSVAARDEHQRDWTDTLERFAEYLAHHWEARR